MLLSHAFFRAYYFLGCYDKLVVPLRETLEGSSVICDCPGALQSPGFFVPLPIGTGENETIRLNIVLHKFKPFLIFGCAKQGGVFTELGIYLEVFTDV